MGAHPQPRHAGSQDSGNGKLVLPQLNRLHRHSSGARFPPRRLQAQDQQPNRPTPIPTQRRLTQQLTKHWPPFKALRQRASEQRQLHLPQKHKSTVQDSTLRVEMNALEEQADNAKPAISTGSPFHGSGPSVRPPRTIPSTQRSGRLLSPRRLHDGVPKVWVYQCFPPSPVSIIARLQSVAANNTP